MYSLFADKPADLSQASIDLEVDRTVASLELIVPRRFLPVMLRHQANNHRLMAAFCADAWGRWDLARRKLALEAACRRSADELEPANE